MILHLNFHPIYFAIRTGVFHGGYTTSATCCVNIAGKLSSAKHFLVLSMEIAL